MLRELAPKLMRDKRLDSRNLLMGTRNPKSVVGYFAIDGSIKMKWTAEMEALRAAGAGRAQGGLCGRAADGGGRRRPEGAERHGRPRLHVQRLHAGQV